MKTNQLDQFIEKFHSHLDAKTIEILSNPENAFIAKFAGGKLIELHNFKILFTQHYIRGANTVESAMRKDYSHSKYKKLLNFSEDVFRENFFETIRLGYVGAFHKYEAFSNELLQIVELIFDKPKGYIQPILRQEIELDVKDYKSFSTLSRINWISNCTKHYDGFALKTPIPVSCFMFTEGERVKPSYNLFKQDLDALTQLYNHLIEITMRFGQFHMLDEQMKTYNSDEANKMYQAGILSLKNAVQLNKLL